MIEEWKLIKTFESTTQYFIEGDKLYVSNTGKVRLNDIVLEYGKGLYVDNKGNIQVVLYTYPYPTLYRTIYTLYKGEIKKGYQIHHIDRNHLNNTLDNLICLTPYEHGKIHRHDNVDPDLLELTTNYRKEYIRLNKLKNKHIKSSKEFYAKRVYKYKQEQQKIKEQEEQLRQKQLEEKKKQKELEIEEKLRTGEYYYSANGTLVSRYAIQRMTESKLNKPKSAECKEKLSLKAKEWHKTHKQIKTDEERKQKSKEVKSFWSIPENKEKRIQQLKEGWRKRRERLSMNKADL